MTYGRDRPGYLRRRVVRALIGYLTALIVAAAVVAVWWFTR